MNVRPPLRALAVLCMSATLGATIATVVSAQRTHEEGCEVRHAIVDGFDAYTDALVRTSAANRTPDELEELKRRAAAFRADLAVTLAPIEAGC